MPPQYHYRGSCTSLDANRFVAGLKHESQCHGESVPFAVRTGLHFMQYNHSGSCMRRSPCRRNTITESRCRQCSVERRVGPCRRNTITEVAARTSMPTESSLVSNTSSLSAPPARECLRRIEPTSKWTATTGMSFSCAPAALHSQNKACTISHGKHLQTQRLKHTVASGTVCARTLAPSRANTERTLTRTVTHPNSRVDLFDR